MSRACKVIRIVINENFYGTGGKTVLANTPNDKIIHLRGIWNSYAESGGKPLTG
jgi:hypothetical protein